MKLNKGSDLPEFSAIDESGNTITKDDIVGQWTILYFYPKDNTPGCTLEAKDFTCLQDKFKEIGFEIIGVSKDSVKSHQSFKSKQGLSFTLLSDPKLEMHRIFETWGDKMMYGKKLTGVIRSTFIVNPEGKIEECFYNVKAKGHAERILKIAKQLG